MSELWLKLIGVDPTRIPDGARTEFMWSHAPRSWGVFVLLGVVVALIYGVLYFYRREIATSPKRVRVLLGIVRSAVLVVLFLVFMGPALAFSEHRTIQSFVVLLIDDSLSMSIKDRYPDEKRRERVEKASGLKIISEGREDPPSRAEVVDAVLNKGDGEFYTSLSKKGKVRVLTFSESVKLRDTIPAHGTEDAEDDSVSDEALSLEKGEPLPPLVPSGRATNLAKGIREALKSLSGSPVSGIVLVTDGQSTKGEDPMAAADLAARRDVPILSVGVGYPGEPRNVRVADVWAPESVFREDPFVLKARVEVQGMKGTTMPVELLSRKSDAGVGGKAGAGTVVARKTLQFSEAVGQQTATFQYIPKTAGEFIFTVRVATQPNEQLDTDNAKAVAVKVLSEKARVLLISGSPSWEYRMVRTLLTRDKTIDLSCWLQSMDLDMQQDGNTKIRKLPTKIDDWFKYDVILLFDPNPNEFGEEWVEAMKRYLGEHGGGMLWMAGSKYTARFLSKSRTRAIAEVLPVKVGMLSAMETLSLGKAHAREWPMRLTATGADHVLLRLHKDPMINRRWCESLPGVYWSYPIKGAKPASQILIEHSDPRLRRKGKARPLLVAGHYGPGRTLFMGFDGTWRWRKLGEKHFDRYWIQAVRFLVEGRLMGGKRRGRIGTDRDLYAIGDRIAVTAKLYTDDFKPLERQTVPAVLNAGTAAPREFELKTVPGRVGQYQATLTATTLGINEIVVELSREKTDKKARITRRLMVETPRVEFADPRLNKSLLTELARRTNGKYFEIDELDAVKDSIPDRRETIVVPGKPIELWDTSRLLLLLVALLTLEWALRKYFKLL